MTADQVLRREYFQKQFRNDEFWKGFLNNKDAACFYADKSTFECMMIGKFMTNSGGGVSFNPLKTAITQKVP